MYVSSIIAINTTVKLALCGLFIQFFYTENDFRKTQKTELNVLYTNCMYHILHS